MNDITTPKNQNTDAKPLGRNYSIEILRFALMFLIVIEHYCTHGLNYYVNEYTNHLNSDLYPLHLIFSSVGMLGVSGFMFISGFYGIRFRFDRLKSLWLQVMFYLLVTGIIFLCATGNIKLIKQILLSVLPFGQGGLWFITCYVIVLIISPIINEGIKRISKRDFKLILLLLIGLLYFDLFASGNLGTTFELLLTIYLLARYIAIYGINVLDKNAGKIFAIGMTILVIVPPILGYAHLNKLILLFLVNYNPVVLLTAISLVLLITRKKLYNINPIIATLLSNTVAIYIITENKLIRGFLVSQVQENPGCSIWLILGCILGICVLSLIIEQLRRLLMKPIEKIDFFSRHLFGNNKDS